MQHQRQALLDEVASEAAIAGFDEAEVNDDNDDDDASDDEKRLPDGWIREDSRSNPGKFVYVHSESGTRCGKRPTLSTERGLIDKWVKKRREGGRVEVDESGGGSDDNDEASDQKRSDDGVSRASDLLSFKSDGDMGSTIAGIDDVDGGVADKASDDDSRGRFESNMVAGDSDSDSMGGYSEDPSVASEGADADQARQDAMLDNDSDSSSEAYSLEIAE